MVLKLKYEDLMSIYQTKLITDKIIEYYDIDKWKSSVQHINSEYRYLFGHGNCIAGIGLLFNFRTLDEPDHDFNSISQMIHTFKFNRFSLSYKGSRCLLPYNYYYVFPFSPN
jgi:hypothetical protein